MKILRVIASVDPATGGPVAGLRAVTPHLARLGVETEFLTVDERTAGYLESFVGPVHAVGPARGSYSYSARFKRWLERNLGNYDAVIVHGLWQYLGQAVRAVSLSQRKTPYFVFPHGMLDPSLRETYPIKHVKKWLYWVTLEHRVLRDAKAVLFTCEEERRLAGTTFPRYHCRERVVSYGTAAPEGDATVWQRAWRERCPALADRPYLLFLGRVHSKKGVDVLLQGYAHLAGDRGGDRSLPDLVLAGPCLDNDYLKRLRELAQSRGISERVHWTGMLTGDAKWGALNEAEAFILPSHQENFGIAVVEALACGTPVLLSDRVNIWREIAQDGAALVEKPTEEGVERLLHRWLMLEPSSRQKMRDAARSSFLRRFEVTHAAKNLADVLSASISKPI